MEKRITINIRGILVAAAWKHNGEISAVDIAGYDEKRYRVADDHLGAQLLAMIKKRIVVDGILKSENNNSVIHIHHFHIDTSDVIKAVNEPDAQ